MKKLLTWMLVFALVVGTLPVSTNAGGILFRRSAVCSNGISSVCSNKVAVVQSQKVQTIVSVQSVPVQVTFVPSQVLLNGQVTQYNSSPFSYSYQGSAIDKNAYAQQQKPQVAVNTVESRLDRMERLMEEMAKRQGISIQTVEKPEMALSVQDQQHLATTWTSCKNCHSPGGKGSKKLIMFDPEGQVLAALPRYKIYQAVESGSMPQDPTKRITGEQLEALRKWVHQGLTELKY